MRSTILYEGNRGRRLPNIAQMNTDPQSGTELVPWVPALDYIGTYKSISENGTYKAEDEPLDSEGNGIWAYTKVNVNVAGGAAGTEDEIEDEEQMDSEEYDETEEAEEGNTEVAQDVEPAGTVEPETGKVKKGAITGKDPVTGKKTTVKTVEKTDPVTGKKKSILEKVQVPDAIVITKMPDKMRYKLGDTIDYSGIECSLRYDFDSSQTDEGGFNVSGKPFKDSWYPDSKIPFNELIFPTKIVDRQGVAFLTIGNTAAEAYSGGKTICYQIDNKGNFGRTWIKANDGVALAFMSEYRMGSWVGPILISPSLSNVQCLMREFPEAKPFMLGYKTVIYDGIKWYIMDQYHWSQNPPDYTHWVTSLPWLDLSGSPDWLSVVKKALNNFRCSWGNGDGIPVVWKSPYDGTRLTTRFYLDIA